MKAVETETDQLPESDGPVPTGRNLEPDCDTQHAASEVASAGTMTITFKLFATLQDLLPRGSVKNAVPIEVASDTTLYEIIDRYKVPRELAHLVLVNGVFYCDADRNAKGLLKPGDVLAIWPPVAGG